MGVVVLFYGSRKHIRHSRMGVAQLLCIGIILAIGGVNSSPFAKKSDSSGLVKRPFCNAFTGCGRKRSDPSINEYSELPSEAELLGGANVASNDWGRIYQGLRGRSTDGQRRFGFFPGYLRKKRSVEGNNI